MDITAESVRDAQFRQAWKGYDTAEVDDFLDQVAAGFDTMARRVSDLSERLDVAEDRALRAEARPALRSEPDESVRRTLVLAQRAADLVVSEAKAVGDRIVADAREEAARMMLVAKTDGDRIREDANGQAQHVLSDAEAAAARVTATRAAELQTSLNGLVEEQTRRQVELDQLGGKIQQAKAQFRGLLTAQLQQLDTVGHGEQTGSPDLERQVEEALSRGAAGDSDPTN
jgi:DivIVA domain-containing protein